MQSLIFYMFIESVVMGNEVLMADKSELSWAIVSKGSAKINMMTGSEN